MSVENKNIQSQPKFTGSHHETIFRIIVPCSHIKRLYSNKIGVNV